MRTCTSCRLVKWMFFVSRFCRRRPKTSSKSSSWDCAASEQCLSVIMTQTDRFYQV